MCAFLHLLLQLWHHDVRGLRTAGERATQGRVGCALRALPTIFDFQAGHACAWNAVEHSVCTPLFILCVELLSLCS